MADVEAMPSGGADNPSAANQQNGGSNINQEVLNKIREVSLSYTAPDIYRRSTPGHNLAEELNVEIYDWAELRQRKERELLQAYGNAMQHANFIPTQGLPVGGPSTAAADAIGYLRPSVRPVARLLKTTKSKSTTGRTYTSKFRGVHQTFPTRRWEAQFRRNGKPTSLGCFDQEEEAARAYDKMMLWCELHNATGVKGGITNFDPSEYESDLQWLQQVSQDELVAILRSDGRRQAAQRSLKIKKESQANTGPQYAAQQAAIAAQQAVMGQAAAAAMVAVAGSLQQSPAGVYPTTSQQQQQQQ